MLGSAAPFPWFLLLAGGLRVQTATPDALCPDPVQVRAAVQDRLGELDGTGEWVVAYGVVHHPEEASGDALRLELRDPRGRARLRRELPRHGESCAALAQAIAIVVDNYFRRPDGDGDAVADDSARARDAIGGTPAPAVPATLDATTSAAPHRSRVTGGLLMGWAAAGGRASPALAFGFAVSISPRWTAGLDGAWLTVVEHQALDDATTVTARSAIARPYLACRWRPTATVDLWLGPELVATIDRAGAPALGGAVAQWRGGWGAGAHGGAAWWLARPVALWAMLALDDTPPRWAGDFTVRGFTGPVLAQPSVRAFAGLGVLFALSR